MAVLNLPDEPNSPAGKAIQTASAPSAEKLAAKNMPNKFQLVFKSNAYLGDSIHGLLLDLCRKEIVFTATENGEYKWIDWLLNVPEDESVTLFFLDEDKKNRCVLIMEGIYVFEHSCTMKNPSEDFGIEYSENLEHKVVVQFNNIERIYPGGQVNKAKVGPVRKNKEKNE